MQPPKGGFAMYTIKDIANEVGVSPTTVSLVLNKRPCRVSDETRKRIQDVAKEHNYAPNYSARALVTKQTRTLGLIMPDISNPYFSELAKGIEREAHKQGYFVIFCNSNDQGKKDVENLQLLLNRQVDGVVLVSSISDDEIPLANEFNALAARSRVPVVQFDRQLIGSSYDIVSVNHRMGGYLATRFLLSQGYRSIGCITGPLNRSFSRDRLEGYLDALREYNIPKNDALIASGDFTLQSGLLQAQPLLENGCDGIFACNDLMAIGVIKALKKYHYRLGEDFGLVGFDNNPFCEYLETPLTSVDQNIYDMGKETCRLVIKRIRQSRKPSYAAAYGAQEIRFTPGLVIRSSAGPKK